MFFIYDCNGAIVGNPKGYPTFKGAHIQAHKRNAPAYRAIWAAYDARAVSYDNNRTPLENRKYNISSIRLNEEI